MVLRSGLLAIALLLAVASPMAAASSASPTPASPSPTTGPGTPLLGSILGALGGVRPATATEPTIEQLIGQKLIVRMGGTRPSRALLERVRAGHIGGVVLLGTNVRDQDQLRRLTRRLQREAARGGQPPLLIAVDQEGGGIRRLTWAPPTVTVPEMGRRGSTQLARQQGRRTGRALRDTGANVDLAPVADIPHVPGSFMRAQGRTFSDDAAVTTRLANAFARGLADTGVLATMKHFPGLGYATRNTDRLVEVIRQGRGALEVDLRPYRQAIRQGVPLIMLSNATYTAWDRRAAAGWSRAIVHDLLREELGFQGVTMTDSLDGTANSRDLRAVDLALRAARAGTDLLLLTGSERTTTKLFDRLVREATAGDLPLDRLRESYDRILQLKSGL